ncbi:MAG: sulfate transporter CysZ [Acidiferrobacterales bacterium]
MVSDLFIGPRYLLRGFALITRRGLRRFFLIPLLINVVVFAGLIGIGVSQFDVLVDWLLPTGDSWWAMLARGLLWTLFALATALVVFFTFTVIANLIAAPFNGLLAARVERALGGHASEQVSARGWVAGVATAVASELRKFRYFVIILLFPIVLTLIPVVNILAPFVWIGVTAWMLALEYLAYPLENHGFQFRAVRRMAHARRIMTLSFGIAVMAATLIPFINLAVMPASVAAATALWIDRKELGMAAH